MIKRAHSILLTLLLPVAVACSGSGTGGSDDGEGDDDGGTDGVVTDEPTAVTGQFFLGDQTTPAEGHEIWVIDHDDGSYLRQDLDPTGAFSIPIERFVEDHVYSLELVRGYQSLGPIDLSAPNDGVQSGFLYEGGFGFDLGKVVLALDDYGRYDPDAGSLLARVGGGFSLSNQSALSLAAIPLPEDVNGVSMSSDLTVTDPQTVLSAFYRRSDYPDLYQRAVAEGTRVQFEVTTERNDMYDGVEMLQAGDWLNGSRLSASPATAWATAPRWIDSAFKFTQTAKKTYKGSAFAGRALPVGSLAVVQLRPKSDAGYQVPAILQQAFTMIPKVSAVGFNGAGTAAVDYESSSALNGLTRAFCRTGDVSLVVEPPLDESGGVIDAANIQAINATFDYFGLAGNRSVELKAAVADFAGDFDDVYTDSPNADLTRTWDPETRTVTLEFSAAGFALPTQDFDLWSELFLTEAGEGSVFSIRVRLTYQLTDGSTAATVIWFSEDC